MARIRIRWRRGEVVADLAETASARALLAVLPMQTSANTWGDELYFHLPAHMSVESDAMQVVEPGTVCYWVEGNSLALPYGPTPISKGTECRLATKVNILGKLEGDPRVLAAVLDGESLHVECIES